MGGAAGADYPLQGPEVFRVLCGVGHTVLTAQGLEAASIALKGLPAHPQLR